MAEARDLKSLCCGFESHHPHVRTTNDQYGHKGGDQLVTHCTRCRYGVFIQHKWTWTRIDGIVHNTCLYDGEVVTDES
jgi:hypothetical protein